MSPPQREQFGQRCDALVHGGLIALLAFSPLAIGSVHAWSLAIVQLLVVMLAIVWASKVLVCGSTADANDRLRRWCRPLLCFGAIALTQLIPMPPSLLRVVSPETHRLYRENLPGWPQTKPFENLANTVEALQTSSAHAPLLGPLPSVRESRRSPDFATEVGQLTALAEALPAKSRWRPLSVYAYRSGEQLLRIAIWSTLFFCSLATRGRVIGERSEGRNATQGLRRQRRKPPTRFCPGFASGSPSSLPWV